MKKSKQKQSAENLIAFRNGIYDISEDKFSQKIIKDYWQYYAAKKYKFSGRRQYVEAQIIASLIDRNILQNRATFHVYRYYYLNLCKNQDIRPRTHIGFSKFVCNNFNIWIQNLKRNGKKYRVFREIKK